MMSDYPMEKRILQGITISFGPAILSCTLVQGQVLVFISINRHNRTMNFVEEMQRGLIPPDLKSWPLQLIEHLINTTSVAPPPAGPVGPPVESEFYNMSSIYCCILQFRAHRSFVV